MESTENYPPPQTSAHCSQPLSGLRALRNALVGYGEGATNRQKVELSLGGARASETAGAVSPVPNYVLF